MRYSPWPPSSSCACSYFAYAVRKPAAWLLRAGITTGWWAGMMRINHPENTSEALHTAYNTILRVNRVLALSAVLGAVLCWRWRDLKTAEGRVAEGLGSCAWGPPRLSPPR